MLGKDIRFIFIERNPLAVVNSALQHKGVPTWRKRARFNRLIACPNKFLGLSSRIESRVLFDASAYALRYRAAKNQFEEVRARHPDFCGMIFYEDLVEKPDASLAKLFGGRLGNWVEVRDGEFPSPKLESVNKYGRQLERN